MKNIYDRPTPEKFALDAYKFDGYGKKISVFGTNHGLRNPADTMFTQIELEFDRISPQVVFVEAITSYLHPTSEENISMGADSGFLRYLAYKNGVEAYVWDLDLGEMYNLLRREFSREDLYLFFHCLKLRNLVSSLNSALDILISSKSRELSVMGIPLSQEEWNPEHFKSIFKRRFNLGYSTNLSQQDWAPVDNYFENGALAKLKSKLFQLRDQRLLKTIGDFAKNNDRIFIQTGAQHKEVMKQVLPLYMESFNEFKPKKQITQIESLEEDSLEHPYYRKIKVGNKELLLWSSSTPEISQNDQLSRDLLAFKPSIILIEDFPEHYAKKQENIKLAGEPGLIRYLGAKNDLPVYNWATQTSNSLYSLLPKYKREDVCSAVTFHYVLKYEQMFKNFTNYNDFWNVMSARLLCSNTMFTYYEASIGRFSENATGYGIISATKSHQVDMDFEKLRTALKSPNLISINNDLELLKANELLNSVTRSLEDNDRIFVHAPYKYIKSLENSIPSIVNYLKL
ncbi:hypothetical protein [Pedobacter sp. B4-66]|uniref:hypothetical protein n=1 Tax=Pedobacter sp. B4-66 TaxID=2817280 RepID=UPI001BDB2BB2|nr:hypothetical protein [Pedobacter sp. B4-66]